MIINKVRNKIQRYVEKIMPLPSLIKSTPKGDVKLCHISAFSYSNAGDTLLPVVLRDLFNDEIGVRSWLSIHVHSVINNLRLAKINKTNGLVIGGGGLFLKDTNPNELSGWQWSCGINNLEKINVPIIMFAVGYNRFRGQEEFDPIFKEHLNVFIRKAKFVGIRNHGSINKLKPYLEESLKEKLVFQPCMTTVISKIYPNYTDYRLKEDFIAFNCAFDRQKLRSGDDSILVSIAKVAKQLSTKTKIKYFSHMKSDNKILPYFDKLEIDYELVEFKSLKEMVNSYSRARLVIGMRGHAQMIPFGCNTAILSIVSHDKMQWFLDDINHPEWGVDILDHDFEEALMTKSEDLYNNYQDAINEIKKAQDNIWLLTQENLKNIKEKFYENN